MVGQRIRVAHFLNSPGVPGGVEEHVYGIVENLPEDRFEVSVICPDACYDFFAPLASSHRKVIRLDVHQYSAVAAMRQLVSILRRERIMIAHSHQFFATFFLAPLAKLARVPIVVETTHVREAWRRGWLKRSYLIDRLIYTLVDRFIAVSQSNQRYLVDDKHCAPDRVLQIYPGREMKRFVSSTAEAEAVRREYQIAPSDFLIVHLGRLAAQKGHAHLFDALPQVLQHGSKIKVLLVGDGELRASLEQDVKRRGLDHVVIFAGFQASVPRFLEAADLVVLPSLFEGLPHAPMEAGAMGKVIIASAVDGVPEVVKDGETGLLVPPGDSARLADAIITTLADEGLRARMGAAARQFIRETFSVERQVKAHIELYESLVRAV